MRSGPVPPADKSVNSIARGPRNRRKILLPDGTFANIFLITELICGTIKSSSREGPKQWPMKT